MTDAEFAKAQEEIRDLNRRTHFAAPTNPTDAYEQASHHAEFGSAFPVK